MKVSTCISCIVLVFACSVFSLNAAELPPMKAGLWKVVTNDRGATSEVEYCIDDNTVEEMLGMSNKITKSMCSDLQINKLSESSYSSTIDCKMMGSTIAVRSTVTGDFSKRYETNTNISYSPPLMGKSQDVSKSTATYVGACPAGMQAGEMKTDDGETINPNEMMKNMPDPSKLLEGLQGGSMPNPEDMQKMLEQMQQMQQNAG